MRKEKIEQAIRVIKLASAIVILTVQVVKLVDVIGPFIKALFSSHPRFVPALSNN